MRYMMLIYSRERDAELTPEERAKLFAGHSKVIADANAIPLDELRAPLKR